MSNRYSDLDMSLLVNPNTGDFAIKTDSAAIKQHIRLLFLDDQILFKPETRNGIGLELFENWNSHTKYILNTRIKEHIRVYEPRIEVLDLETSFDYSNGNLSISLTYKVNQETDVQNFRFVVSYFH